MKEKAKRRTRRIAWVASFALLAIMVVITAKKSDPKKFLEIASHASPGWLGVAVALQTGTYLCAAGVLWLGLGGARKRPAFLPLVPLGLMKIFVDQALPAAGTGGTILTVRAMKKQGFSGAARPRPWSRDSSDSTSRTPWRWPGAWRFCGRSAI